MPVLLKAQAVKPSGLSAPWRVSTLWKDRVQQFLFIAPTTFYLVVLTLFPFVYSVYLSLHKVRLTTLHRKLFIGLQNYVNLLHDGLFMEALWNTALLIIFSLILEILIGFAMAKVFYEIRRLPWVNGLRSVYLMPMMLTPLSVGVTFGYILNPTLGIMNYLLQCIGVAPVAWLGEPIPAQISILMINVWQWSPFMMLLILAGLTSIPHNIYEAAEVDGAKWHHIVRFVEIPSVQSIIMLGVILRIIDMLRFFDVVYVATRGGPANATMLVTLYAYQEDFQYFDVGQGSAAAVLILIISIVVTTFAVRFMRSMEYEQA
jgi:multiple sugar transport system permease protein